MVVFAVKVMIHSLKLKFSRNSFFYVLLKFNLSSFVEIFVRVLYKEKFIVITPFKTGTYPFVALHLFLELINPRLCIKPEIQKRGTECEERGEWGENMGMLYPGNVSRHFGECRQTFRVKHSG